MDRRAINMPCMHQHVGSRTLGIAENQICLAVGPLEKPFERYLRFPSLIIGPIQRDRIMQIQRQSHIGAGTQSVNDLIVEVCLSHIQIDALCR